MESKIILPKSKLIFIFTVIHFIVQVPISMAQAPTTQDVYGHLRRYIRDYWDVSQHTSDETFVPPRITSRGQDWVDNGVWLEMQEHSWDSFSPAASFNFRGLWDDSFRGISLANEVLQDLLQSPGTEIEQAEMRVLRAFFYYQLMDFFGGVPIIETFPLPEPLPAQDTRSEVFNFIEAELLSAIPNLVVDPTGINYGKVSTWVAYTFLAKIYLNAEVYTGAIRWQDCIDACDAVINSGWYNLTVNYFDNFILSNENSPENIFVIPFSSDPAELQGGMNFYMRTLHYNQLAVNPWNGFTTLADFYNSFNPSDLRMGDTNNGMIHQGFLVGQQKDDIGTDLNDRLGNPLIFTVEVPLIADESQGVRVLKYEADKTAPAGQGENDYAIFRYADILLMKAESLLRLGNSSEALILVNLIRERAFDPDNPLSSITLDDILKERGFEMYWEGFRRQDLIRFGKFNDAWTNKEVTPSYTRLLPIPQVVLDRNPDLVQNSDYDFLPVNILDQSFTRITSGANVNDDGSAILSNWFDYDNDGYLDLFVINFEGESNSLYRNNGDDTFIKITNGSIVNDIGKSHYCSWGDYDNDGYGDLYVSNWWESNFLYHNNRDGTFEKITTGAIVTNVSGSHGSSWGDYNNDGYLDLFVANRGVAATSNNLLYKNNGNGTFTKITSGDIVNDGGNSFSGNWADYNNDGYLDLFVANGGWDLEENDFLYKNNGDGTFLRITSDIVVTDGGKSFGANWIDYDNDGDLDLFVISDWPDKDRLYTNNGDGTFTKDTGSLIIQEGNSFYSSWMDYDNDGDLDLYIIKDNTNGPLFQNNGDGTFTRISFGNIVNDDIGTKGFSWGDYDNDGDMDLFVVHGSTLKNSFFSNDGNSNNWINIKCVGTLSNTFAIGTKVKVKAKISGIDVWQLHEVSGQTGGGHGAQNSLNAEFGLGDASIIDSLKIEWPSGLAEVFENVLINQFVIAVEGNFPPTGENDLVTTDEDTAVEIAVLDNDIDADGDNLTLQIDDPSLNGAVIINADNTITYTPDANFNGNDSFSYIISDGSLGGSDTLTVSITIDTINDAPTFTKGEDITLDEDAGAQSIAWATGIDDGDDEVTQILTFEIVSVSNTDLFGVQPAIANDGTLTFTSVLNENGTATITIKLKDDGGTANGGNDESATELFDIIVTPVNDAPTVAVPIPDQNPIYEYTFTFGLGTFEDVEDSELTYTATLADDSPLPTWLTFDALTRTFSGTPEVGEGSFIIKVTATDSGGLSVSDEFALDFLITGSEDPNLSKMMVMYPNPATGEIDLLIYDAYTGDVTISVIDNNGSILFMEKINKRGAELRHTIDLSGNSNGIYLIRVQTGNRETLLRAVKH